MSLTKLLLQQPLDLDLTVFSSALEEPINVKDLLKQVAREMFNGTMPVLQVDTEKELKRAIQLGVAAKYVPAKDVIILDDLFCKTQEVYTQKLHDKLIRAAKSMGTHVPKMMSTCIDDGACYFVSRSTALLSGITSSTMDSGRHITGSKDGTLIAAFGFLSTTYQVGDGPALSLFERIVLKEEPVLKLLCELGQDNQFVEELVQVAQQQQQAIPSNKISQFQKQNFINYNSKRITVSPLQSVNTTVSLKHAIDNIYNQKGRVNVKRYFAGGANTQNVSSLNQDIGGSIPHLKAWIPSQSRRYDVFYTLYRTKRLSLSKTQKSLISTLVWSMNRIEDKSYSNYSDRKVIDNLLSQLSELLRIQLEEFASEIRQLTDTKKLVEISIKMNSDIKAYFKAETISEKTEASELLALQLIALAAAEMKRNKLDNIHVEDSALDIATKILEKGDVRCRLL